MLSPVLMSEKSIQRLPVGKMKTDAPLRIDSNTPLPAALTLQGFEPIARRRMQVADGLGGVDHEQLAACERLHVKRQ